MIDYKVLGFLAAIFTTSSFLPQAIKTIKTKNTQGISLFMYAIFSLGVLLWLIYGFVINDLPVIIANAITLVFAIVILIYKIKYK
jgi:MtN3 and saliva related transmembrane protein